MPTVKVKNYLTAKMMIEGNITVRMECRKLANGKYRWYGDDGTGSRWSGIPSSPTLTDAKQALLATYPPSQCGLQATWLR